MLDHFNLPVSKLEKSIVFYETILKTLNMQLLLRDGDAVGFGKNSWEFGIVQTTQNFVPIHLAFSAASHEEVCSFYKAAMEVGGIDNGHPGIREEYGPRYYAAYILDPDGHNVEAVCRYDNNEL